MDRVPSRPSMDVEDLDELSLPSPQLPGDAFMRSGAFELPEEEQLPDDDGMPPGNSKNASLRREWSGKLLGGPLANSIISSSLTPWSKVARAASEPVGLVAAAPAANLPVALDKAALATSSRKLESASRESSSSLATRPSLSVRPSHRRASSGGFTSAIKRASLPPRKEQSFAVTQAYAEKAGAPKHGDMKRAMAASLMRTCVKKQVARRKGRYIDPTGVRVNLERFQWCTTPYTRLHEFGCPIAVTLYMEFLIEGGFLFLVMALIALPSAIDAIIRNIRRRQCRALAVATPSRAGLAATAAEELLHGCGYDGVALRESLPSSLDVWGWHLMPAFGTCMEYAQMEDACDPTLEDAYWKNYREDAQPRITYCNITSAQVIRPLGSAIFARLNHSADFCADGWTFGIQGGPRLSGVLLFWGVALNVLVFVIFLLRVRRMQARQEAVISDKSVAEHVFTAADFTVMVTGLDKVPYDDASGMPDMERRLRADLQRLGFEKAAIDHIEIARGCSQEMAILHRLAALKSQRQQLLFRLALQHERNAQAPARGADASQAQMKKVSSIRGRLAKNEVSTKAARRDMDLLASSEHMTTGHAFIVFQTIADRDRFITMFTQTPHAIGEGGLAELVPYPLRTAGALLRRRLSRFCPRLARGCGACADRLLAWGGEGRGDAPSDPNASGLARTGAAGTASGGKGRSVAGVYTKQALASASWRTTGVEVVRAPEPSDVYWENLELSDDARTWKQLTTNLIIFVMIIIGTVLLYFVRTVQVAANQNLSVEQDDAARILSYLSVSGLAAGVTIVWNLILRAAIEYLTELECHVTRSRVELAVFTKLICAYSLNTVFVPIFVSVVTLQFDRSSQSFVGVELIPVTQVRTSLPVTSDFAVDSFSLTRTRTCPCPSPSICLHNDIAGVVREWRRGGAGRHPHAHVEPRN